MSILRLICTTLLCAVALGGAAAQGPTGIQSPNNPPQNTSGTSSLITSGALGIPVHVTDYLAVNTTPALTHSGGFTVMNVFYRIRLPNGTEVNNLVSQNMTLATGQFTPNPQNWIQLQEGTLELVTATPNQPPSGYIEFGDLYIQVFLAPNNSPSIGQIHALCAGSASQLFSYTCNPVTGQSLSPQQYPGTIQTFTVANPTAGVDWSYTVGQGTSTANLRFRIIAITALLTSSATVANRLVRIRFTDGAGNIIYQTDCMAVVQAASQVEFYEVSGGSSFSCPQIGTGGSQQMSIPNNFWIQTGTITSSTLSLQAADQWSLITIRAEVQNNVD